MKIRCLTSDDWKIWKPFRLAALKNSPQSFASSYEEEVNWSDLAFQEGLNHNTVFAALEEKKLIASAGFYRLDSLKTKHKGIIWGMYTHPDYRGRGVASALIQEIVIHARDLGVIQVHLTPITNNLAAIKLYQKLGFEIYGTEPRALKMGDVFFDEHLMMLDLTKNK